MLGWHCCVRSVGDRSSNAGGLDFFLLRAFGLSGQSKDADRDARARMSEGDGSEGAAQNPAMVAFPAEKLDAREGRISPQ